MSTAAGSGPSRRAVLAAVPLAGAGALLLVATAGCTGAGTTAPEPTADPADTAAAAAAHARESDLLAAYDTAINRHPDIAGTLRALRAHHAEHAQALVALGLPGIGPTAGPRPGPSSSPSSSRLADTPEAQAATLTALATLERTTAAAHRAGCLKASPGLAPLMASLCAAESAHAELVALTRAAG